MSGHRKFWPHFDAIFLLSHLSLNFPELFWKFLEMCLHLQHLLWNFGLSVIPFFYDVLGVDPLGRWSPSQDYSSLECSGWIWRDWVSIKEVVHQGPGDSHQPSTGTGGVQPLRQDVLIRFLALSLRSFFCYTTQSHLFQTVSVSVWERLTVVTLVSIFGTCVTFSFCFRKFFCIQYGGGRLLFRELSSSSDGSSAESEPLVKDTCSVQQGQSSWIWI